MANYILARQDGKANIHENLWYCASEEDKDILKANENVYFADKVYVIPTKKLYIMNNEGEWIEMTAILTI